MAEPTSLDWDKEEANSLFISYREHWNKSNEFGITGKGDAGTGKPNSKTVWETIMNHGKSGKSRKDKGWYGAADIIFSLEEILDEEDVFVDDIEDTELLIEHLQELEDSPAGTEGKNPRNIPFHTITEFKPGEGDKDPIIVRDVVYGHFLTEAYWEFRKDKAEKKEEVYNVTKPQTYWSNKEQNKARPPLWEALFGPENSLKVLLQDVLELLKDAKLPPGPINVDFRFNKRSVVGLAGLSAIQDYVWALVENPSIYQKGTSRKPMQGRLNQLANNTLIRISSKGDIQEMSKIATITLTTDEGPKNVRLDEIPGWKKIKELKVSWPTSNKFLLKLIREVMGDQEDTFQKPGSDPEVVKPGLLLKSPLGELMEYRGVMYD